MNTKFTAKGIEALIGGTVYKTEIVERSHLKMLRIYVHYREPELVERIFEFPTRMLFEILKSDETTLIPMF